MITIMCMTMIMLTRCSLIMLTRCSLFPDPSQSADRQDAMVDQVKTSLDQVDGSLSPRSGQCHVQHPARLMSGDGGRPASEHG
jgi:hypothetical protein